MEDESEDDDDDDELPLDFDESLLQRSLEDISEDDYDRDSAYDYEEEFPSS